MSGAAMSSDDCQSSIAIFFVAMEDWQSFCFRLIRPDSEPKISR